MNSHRRMLGVRVVDTLKAVLVRPSYWSMGKEKEDVWIPRSVIRAPEWAKVHVEGEEEEFEVEAWLVRKQGLECYE